jgi:hypothetical protein
MKINIKYHDIVNYVLGSCGYHPLELAVDPVKYIIGEDCIKDKKTGKIRYQDEDYFKFMQKIRTLKDCCKDFDTLQIQSFCREIEQFAPLEVNLP